MNDNFTGLVCKMLLYLRYCEGRVRHSNTARISYLIPTGPSWLKMDELLSAFVSHFGSRCPPNGIRVMTWWPLIHQKVTNGSMYCQLRQTRRNKMSTKKPSGLETAFGILWQKMCWADLHCITKTTHLKTVHDTSILFVGRNLFQNATQVEGKT